MPIFSVTHIIGEQGFGEVEIVTEGIDAATALDAIFKVAPPDCRSWTQRSNNWNQAFLLNPKAPNRSEEYCDYYHAELTSL
jgi:hypothetical protein